MPNVSTRISDKIVTQTVNLLRVEASLRKQILRDLNRLEADLVDDLNRATKSELTLARLRALLTQTRATIETAYAKISEGFTPQLKEIAIAIARKTIEGVNAVVRVELMSVGMTQTQIEYIAGKTIIEGHVQAAWWRSQAAALRNKFALQMRQGQYRGEGVDQLVRRVRGTRANGYTDGIMNVPRHQAEALVRTSVMSVGSEARLASYLANRDVIKSIQWVATLDGRTSDICLELNGKIWDLPESGDKDADYIPVGHSTPFPGAVAHWNERSVQTPITYSFAELAKKEATSAG